jgi:intracellular sulfur oxidation DsrE/DsrF family protein
MFKCCRPASSGRRSFLSRLGIGLTGGAALGAAAVAPAQAQTSGRFQPARHAADDWLDLVPGQHRFVFDAISPEGINLALTFINNYLNANDTGYGLKDHDLAVVLILRHRATPFAFSNAIWAKHGAAITQRTEYMDPATKQPPKVNLFAGTPGERPQAERRSLSGLAARGVQFAVCGVSTRNYAGAIATATGGNADEVFKELSGSLLEHARIVPAGIITVNRAQERGYALAYTG